MEYTLLLNCICISIFPLAIGMAMRFATRKFQKPLLVTGALILIIAVICLGRILIKPHHSNVFGISAIVFAFLVFGAVISDFIFRYREKNKR